MKCGNRKKAFSHECRKIWISNLIPTIWCSNSHNAHIWTTEIKLWHHCSYVHLLHTVCVWPCLKRHICVLFYFKRCVQTFMLQGTSGSHHAAASVSRLQDGWSLLGDGVLFWACKITWMTNLLPFTDTSIDRSLRPSPDTSHPQTDTCRELWNVQPSVVNLLLPKYLAVTRRSQVWIPQAGEASEKASQFPEED